MRRVLATALLSAASVGFAQDGGADCATGPAAWLVAVLGIVGMCTVAGVAWLIYSLRHHRNRAQTDYLTGIANRGYVFEHGFKLGDKALKNDIPLSLVMLDLDHFKKINDTLGHEAGDKALIAAVEAVKSTLRRGEIFGRLGGEEFAVIMPGVDRDEAETYADEMRLAVANAGFLHAGKHPVNFTVSLGVAVIDPSCDFQTLVNRADEALYVAKNSGRNRLVMASSTSERLSAGFGTVGSRQRAR
jgi:diguanylate cyclase (GGDEF)-like protein